MADAGPPALPAFAEFAAPADWARIDFISDLHLSAAMPRTFAAWSAYLERTPADAVFILGDLFDAWVGDDSRHEGFEAECREVLTGAARRRRIGFMIGNRDFLLGEAMLHDCGIVALADPTVLTAFGQRTLLTHGDALCLADVEYQRYRAQVRDPALQAMALALPLAQRRAFAAKMRHASEQRNAAGMLPAGLADLDVAGMLAWMGRAGAAQLIHGHTHRPGSEALAADRTRHVLSDWNLDTEAVRGEVLSLTRAGLERHPAVAA